MKKLCILLSIICLCSFLLTSCTTNGKDNTATDNTETEVSTLTQEEQLESEKTTKIVKEAITGLLNAKTKEEVSEYVTETPAGYAKSILQKFPHDDYIVTVEKKGEYKECEAFRIQIERESDKEFCATGIEFFKKTDSGYLIETNEEFSAEVEKEFSCPDCKGYGYIMIQEGECPNCDGTAMEYKEKAVYDKETKTWEGSYVDCSICEGKGEVTNLQAMCETCDGNCLVF